MLRLINQLNTVGLGQAYFLTLTTRHQAMTHAQFQAAFNEQFLPGLKRLWGNIEYLWRLEPHRDGFPHYHLIVWAPPGSRDLSKQAPFVQACNLWWSIMKDDTKAHQEHSCMIKRVEGKKAVTRYISKYIAKEDDDIGALIRGRRWARSHNLDTAPLITLHITREETMRLRYFLHVWLKDHVDRPRNSSEYVLDHGDWWLWLDLEQIQTVLYGAGLSHAGDLVGVCLHVAPGWHIG
jgi:hypothetical protein